MSDIPSIMVGVPTFRRPKGLERLLTSLCRQSFPHKFSVVVADNDSERREGEDVTRRLAADGLPFKLAYIIAPDRGISHTRNAILDHALLSGTELLFMIDDDEWASEDWLLEMVKAFNRFDVDVVGGPAIRTYPASTPQYIKRINTITDKSVDSRPIRSLESTANIGLRMSTLRQMGFSFDPDFGLTGGSDRDLLLRMRLAGARFAWSSEAIVFEEFPESRCTPAWAVQRAYRVGNSEMLAYLKNRPPNYAAKEIVKICLALVQASGHLCMGFFSSYHFLRAKVLIARAVGKVTAIFGKKYYEYLRTHGT